MKSDVHDFVQSCLICQKAKTDRARLPGLLQPLPVPRGAWQIITMDFVEGLPRSGNSNCILVVVDKFTKYAHFLPLSHSFTAATVAHTYLHHVYKLHGLPLSIVSNRDRIFTSNFWKELFKLAGVQLSMSSAYHPQSDGQTERVNQCMETFLHCFVHACPKKWIHWLSLAEYWYNTSLHSALGKSPFEVLYGHEPRHFGISPVDSCAVPEVASWLEERAVMQSLIQQHLSRAQQRMKKYADKRRSEHEFAINDLVFLKL
uniref:Integrase catalytic domain-containing protein n=1 Tax=Arundo donax TaxID=35708 RepID=A0A0A8YAL3_ARUDO